MKLTPRESVLACVTLAVILGGVGFWFGEPMVTQWNEDIDQRRLLAARMEKAQRLLEREPQINERLNNLRKQLPRHPQDLDVTSQLLKTLQRTADQHGLLLVRQEPSKEKNVGELYELSINCAWEGELDALVHFLYALQSQGAMVDLQQLSIAPSGRVQGQLKGNFEVDFAYSRETATQKPET